MNGICILLEAIYSRKIKGGVYFIVVLIGLVIIFKNQITGVVNDILKKSSLRAAVSDESGGITVWLSLCFLVFLALYLACLQSVQRQYRRQQAEQAVEAGMFSLFSEYEPHLLERYDLFCLDLSFAGGVQRDDWLCSRLWKHMAGQLADAAGKFPEGLEPQGIFIQDPERLTDDGGAVFYQQAVRIMKEKSGVSLAQDWIRQQEFREQAGKKAERFQEDCEKYEGVVQNYEESEEGEMEAEAGSGMGCAAAFCVPWRFRDIRKYPVKR